MAGVKGKSGGAREGAGRPKEKKTVSEEVKAAYIRAAKELAKEYGESVEKAILRMAYLDNVQDSVKVAVLKAYNEALLVKESAQNVNVNKYPTPVIGLPPMKTDPAKIIPIEGGKKRRKKNDG